MDPASQGAQRRTFAIISHPDAGKTTLTEKLLLYAGAIHLAGSVKGRRAARHAVSDWMQLEQERGISVTSSVLQFAYGGVQLNLLDTPGHADFSEDTLRTLAAVDAAVMLIDHAKGIEARTLKLFEVCRRQGLPIVTFVNKLDRQGLSPLALVDEVARTLDLQVVPHNWPVGMGRDFQGVVGMQNRRLTRFVAQEHGADMALEESCSWEEADLKPALRAQVDEDLELLDAAGDPYDPAAFLAGRQTPVLWGSAQTNFGVRALLDFMVAQAPPPGSRACTDGAKVSTQEPFSGFIFKIQANMNPKHRDRIAFMRVVSGRFGRGMEATVGRSGERLRLAKPHTFLAQERSIVEEAWPGDIVGLYDSGALRIGDTLAEGRSLQFAGIPRFAPEFFARLVLRDPLRRKALDTGITQLSHEGVIQVFYTPGRARHDSTLGAVGMLQFEVLLARLRHEYRTEAILQSLPFRLARWATGDPKGLAWLRARRDYMMLEDRHGQPVVLAESPWAMAYAAREAPGLVLHDVEPL